MSSKKPPCFGCKERQTGCHAECKRYLEWSKDRQKKRLEAWQREQPATAYSVDKTRKNAKNAMKKGTRHKDV